MKRTKALACLLCGTLLVAALLAALYADRRTEPFAHWTPDYAREALEPLIDAGDTDALLRQTGLSPAGLDRVGWRAEALQPYQDAMFADVAVLCTPNSILSKQEEMRNLRAPLVPLEDGDVLVSPCSHVSGWRNGHAALVVDGAANITLESIVLGYDSAEQDVAYWRAFPAFLVFRLKGADAQARAEIAAAARRDLTGIPYGFTAGLFSSKYRADAPPRTTQCSHLVWTAFRRFGYDLDADGGWLVTPRDLANSPRLELVQVFGMQPDTLWRESPQLR